jgi:hypothetical protein
MARAEETNAGSRREGSWQSTSRGKKGGDVSAEARERAGAGVERREGRMKGGFGCWQVVGSVLRCASAGGAPRPFMRRGVLQCAIKRVGAPLGGHSITPKFAKLNYEPATQIRLHGVQRPLRYNPSENRASQSPEGSRQKSNRQFECSCTAPVQPVSLSQSNRTACRFFRRTWR